MDTTQGIEFSVSDARAIAQTILDHGASTGTVRIFADGSFSIKGTGMDRNIYLFRVSNGELISNSSLPPEF